MGSWSLDAHPNFSGKSSIFHALLGFLEIRSGTIYVDGVDISTIPRDTLRSRITTIPQDPYFPSKQSIRLSLTGRNSKLCNADLIATLAKVGLLSHLVASLRPSSARADIPAEKLSDVEMTSLLDAEMTALALSPGQLQLFCLARALLHENRVVLLDEVTSAVDLAAEERLRTVLREGLKEKTVILIAHRPEMIKDCDVVVSIEAGRVISVESRLG